MISNSQSWEFVEYLVYSAFLGSDFRDGLSKDVDVIKAQSSYPSGNRLGNNVSAVIGASHPDF